MAPKTIDYHPTTYYFTYARHEPALWVEPGTSVRLPLLDAGRRDASDRVVPDDVLESVEGVDLYRGNPLAGPICVHGAEPGDTLVCHIRRIDLDRATAWSSFGPGFGCLTGEGPGKRLQLTPAMPAHRFTWKISPDRRTATLAMPRSRLKKITIPLHPFIGSIGVAPRYGRVETSVTPGEYGGNMDCVDTCAGVALHLPVFIRGGYLLLGDVHAAQGDGEICGVALETSAVVTLRLEVRKGRPIDWPRIESRNEIMTVGSARPLWDAFAIAHREMVQWLVADHGFHPDDALQALSQLGRARVGNVVDPNYTVVAKFPKRFLPPPR